jgi:hypothetical protein
MNKIQLFIKNLTIFLYLFFIAVNVGFSQQERDTIKVSFHENRNIQIEKRPRISSIPIETMLGNRNVNYLSILNARIGNSNTLGYFSVITIATPYDEANGLNELVFSNALTYKLTNKLFITGGLQYHFLKGVAPTSGFQFFSANPKWLFVVSSNIAFARNSSFQNVGIVEFKPKLTNFLKLYTRLQGIYNMKLQNSLHERSLLYLRTGLTFQQTSVGLGFNIDFYGASKTRRENFGLFVHHLL